MLRIVVLSLLRAVFGVVVVVVAVVGAYAGCFVYGKPIHRFFLLQAEAARLTGAHFRVRLRKWSQVCRCMLQFNFLIFQCCQDPAKTAYVVADGDLLPVLDGLRQSLRVRPRGEWHISL